MEHFPSLLHEQIFLLQYFYLCSKGVQLEGAQNDPTVTPKWHQSCPNSRELKLVLWPHLGNCSDTFGCIWVTEHYWVLWGIFWWFVGPKSGSSSVWIGCSSTLHHWLSHVAFTLWGNCCVFVASLPPPDLQHTVLTNSYSREGLSWLTCMSVIMLFQIRQCVWG